MTLDCVERNSVARERLDVLVARLQPADLERTLGEGWTVKVALAHLAFWDRFAASALQTWMQSGYAASGEDSPFINSSNEPDWLVLPGDHVLRHVIEAAAAVDA